jgi:hypothetical protein
MKLHYNPFQISRRSKTLAGFMPDKNGWEKKLPYRGKMTLSRVSMRFQLVNFPLGPGSSLPWRPLSTSLASIVLFVQLITGLMLPLNGF